MICDSQPVFSSTQKSLKSILVFDLTLQKLQMFCIDMEQILWCDSVHFLSPSLCELVKNMNLPILKSRLMLQTYVDSGSLWEGGIVSFKLIWLLTPGEGYQGQFLNIVPVVLKLINALSKDYTSIIRKLAVSVDNPERLAKHFHFLQYSN